MHVTKSSIYNLERTGILMNGVSQYDLVNLQIAAYKRYGFSLPKTKRLALELYDMDFISYPKGLGRIIKPTERPLNYAWLNQDHINIYNLIAGTVS